MRPRRRKWPASWLIWPATLRRSWPGAATNSSTGAARHRSDDSSGRRAGMKLRRIGWCPGTKATQPVPRQPHERSGVGRSGGKIELEGSLIDEAPEPLLTRLARTNQRMARRLEMGGWMATGRLVAATHLPTGLTHPEVRPMAPGRRALLTPRTTRLGSGDGVDMSARGHAFTLFAGPGKIQQRLSTISRTWLSRSRRRST